jgi:hypothetical protein
MTFRVGGVVRTDLAIRESRPALILELNVVERSQHSGIPVPLKRGECRIRL